MRAGETVRLSEHRWCRSVRPVASGYAGSWGQPGDNGSFHYPPSHLGKGLKFQSVRNGFDAFIAAASYRCAYRSLEVEDFRRPSTFDRDAMLTSDAAMVAHKCRNSWKECR
mgnify:CR=1 FL=1